MPTRRIIAGAMTGTSLDAIDAALVEVTGTGWDINANALAYTSALLGDIAITPTQNRIWHTSFST